MKTYMERGQIMDNNLILKRFFSKPLLHDLLSGKSNDVFDCVVKRYITDPQGKSYGDLVSEIYTYLGKNYRTEYFYKNTMLNKLLVKRHDYRKTKLPASVAEEALKNIRIKLYGKKSDEQN